MIRTIVSASLLAASIPSASVAQAPAPAQASAPAFPVSGTFCWFNRPAADQEIIQSIMAGSYASNAEREAAYRAKSGLMLRSLFKAYSQRRCSIALRGDPQRPGAIDLSPDVARLIAANDPGASLPSTHAPSRGICTVEPARLKLAVYGKSVAIEPILKRAVEQQRCGALYSIMDVVVSNDAIEVTGPVVAELLASLPACTPGTVVGSRRCIAVGGRWSGKREGEYNQEFMFRGTKGQRIRVTASNPGKECDTRVGGLGGPYPLKPLTASASTPDGAAEHRSDFVLPYTTDYSFRVHCNNRDTGGVPIFAPSLKVSLTQIG